MMLSSQEPCKETRKVRKAEKGDRGAVLNIDNNVYSGMDYLPYAFDSLIDDPSYTYYVVEVDQQVVAFYGVCLIDRGMTLMARSARVKAEFRNRGLLCLILKAVYDEFSDGSQVTRIRTIASAMGNTCALLTRQSFRRSSELLWTRNMTMYQLPLQSTQPLDGRQGQEAEAGERRSKVAPVLTRDSDDFIYFLHSLDEKVKAYLFPTDLFTLRSWHFQLRHLGSTTSRAVWGKWNTLFTVSSCLVEDSSPKPGKSLDISLSGPALRTEKNRLMAFASPPPTVRTDNGEKKENTASPVSRSSCPLQAETVAAADGIASSSSSEKEDDSSIYTESTIRLNEAETPSPRTYDAISCEDETVSRPHTGDESERHNFPGLIFSSAVYPTCTGLACHVDVFGDVTEKVADDVNGHLERLVDWLRHQPEKYGAKEKNMTASVIFYTNSEQDQTALRHGMERFGFKAQGFSMREMNYFWQNFQSLEAF